METIYLKGLPNELNQFFQAWIQGKIIPCQVKRLTPELLANQTNAHDYFQSDIQINSLSVATEKILCCYCTLHCEDKNFEIILNMHLIPALEGSGNLVLDTLDAAGGPLPLLEGAMIKA